jgi:hypothetical protein
MAQALLVKEDIDAGRDLVRLLDEAGFPVTAAAWLYFPDVEEWRLVIGSPRASQKLQDAYMDIAVAMDAKGDLRKRIDLARVKLVPPSDLVLQAMGRAIRAPGLHEIHFQQSVINGIYIDDALIYRLAA